VLFVSLYLICAPLLGQVAPESLTLPLDQRPAWVSRDGIVMAGSWEPLIFRVRRDGSPGYKPTPEQRRAYEREHSAEMVRQLKSLGVNFVMMHCYKAFGLDAERESMADAVKFAKRCHEAGLRVGVYNFSGTLGWELFYKEFPQAKDWVVLDANGQPVTYGGATYRYYVNRNHPDVQAFLHRLVEFAVNEIRADLLHFDNYHVGPGSEPSSAERFRAYLGRTFTPEQRERMGITDLAAITPPLKAPQDDPIRRAWIDFSCRSLADSYYDLSCYARSLRKDILVECNPGGVHASLRVPVDHARLLAGGEAFWDESGRIGYDKDRLTSRIRTYKVARRMDNIAFTYTTTPLEMAEAMAFNLDCLGCVCWFEYGRVTLKPGEKGPSSKDVTPFIRFFHNRRELLRDASVLADVAVLRSFASTAFAKPELAALPNAVEQALIVNRVPFQIIYDRHLNDLKRYRALVLPGCVAMSDPHIALVKDYVGSGGRVLIVGPAATHDEWMFPRDRPGLDGIAASPGVIRIDGVPSGVEDVRKLLDDDPSLHVDAPAGLCTELTRQAERQLVHLVNYRPDGPVKDVRVRLRLPEGKQVRSVALAGPSHDADATLPFEQKGRHVTFTVPSVEVYEIAVASLE